VRADQFFEAPDPQNIVKTKLVSKYFEAWAKIMLPRLTRSGEQLGYLDLFAGPGRFSDGEPSTPLWILKEAIKNPALGARLVTVFNDKEPNLAKRLQEEIDALPGVENLAHEPRVSNAVVGAQLASFFHDLGSAPTLSFIDPWGYKGLSLGLIGTAIRNWGCECIFFFNYNRISPALGNSIVDPLINELFGIERANRLRSKVAGRSPDERQTIITDELTAALRDVGGEYVLPFEFESKHGERPSHYIIFVSKNKRGYFLMKDIMFGMSTDDAEVRRLGYVPVRSPQLRMSLGFEEPYSIPALKAFLLQSCAGKRLSVIEVYEDYTIGTPYVFRHVQAALIELEADRKVAIDPPADRRQWRNGKVTLAKDKIVTFPR
jgi:three-Cys-motif partner protein